MDSAYAARTSRGGASPGPVDWGRPGGGGVEGGASNEIPMQQESCVRLLFIKQVKADTCHSPAL